MIDLTNELYHLEEREEKKDHKYVAKIVKGKKTRYFYTKEEWWAYLKGQQKAKTDPAVKNKKTSTVNTQSATKTTDRKSSIGKTFSDLVNEGKKLLSSLFKSPSKDAKKTETAKTVESAITKMASEGQKFVSSVIDSVTKTADSTSTKKQAEKGKDYVTDKTNENMNMLLIVPTSWIKAAVEFVKDLFTKDDKKTESEAPSAESIDELKRQDEELTTDEQQALINPDYDPYDEEYSMNCAYCTAAYDLRMRGYDVEAMPYDPETYNANVYDISSWYENTTAEDWSIETEGLVYDPNTSMLVERDHGDVIRRTEETLENMPEGSYGQFCVYWTLGGGHSMVWSKENGQTVIRDCQTNETYTYTDWINTYRTIVETTCVLRTDNRKPSNNILKTVRNREDE